jgi:hypothetical protein
MRRLRAPVKGWARAATRLCKRIPLETIKKKTIFNKQENTYLAIGIRGNGSSGKDSHSE